MDNLNKSKADLRNAKASVEDAAGHLLREGKKYAHELYEEGMDKLCDAEESVKEYSDELLLKVKKNPLTSILVAAAAGFLLSSLLRK